MNPFIAKFCSSQIFSSWITARVKNLLTREQTFIVQNIGVEIVSVAEGFGIGAQIIGRCEGSQGENSLIIDSGYGKFTYS